LIKAAAGDAYESQRQHPAVSMSANRRFPPPWSVEDIDAAFVVKDGSGQKVAYVYCEDEPGRRAPWPTSKV
jgi:hypothetical protein